VGTGATAKEEKQKAKGLERGVGDLGTGSWARSGQEIGRVEEGNGEAGKQGNASVNPCFRDSFQLCKQ
jgi:hypothetical protein